MTIINSISTNTLLLPVTWDTLAIKNDSFNLIKLLLKLILRPTFIHSTIQ